MAAHLQHPAAADSPRLLRAEAGVEEARIMHPKLPHRGVDGGHLGGLQGGDLDGRLGGQDVELPRVQQQLPPAGLQRLPEVLGIVAVLVVEIDHARMPPGAEAGQGPGQVHAHVQAAQQRRGAALQAQLVQPCARAHQHAEGLGGDLEIEGPVIARGHVVEAVAIVRQQADEHVHPAGGALRIGPGTEAAGQAKALLQPGDIDAALFQHRALRQVQPVHGHVRQPVGHGTPGPWQERGPHPPGRVRQPQVQAGRLDLVRGKGRCGSDRPLIRQKTQGLAGQDAGRRWGVGRAHGRDTRRSARQRQEGGTLGRIANGPMQGA